MAWVDRTASKLARNLFHLMALNGPALERREVLLGRVVDIGVELFAVACALRPRAAAWPSTRASRKPWSWRIPTPPSPRKRVLATSFHGLWHNEDKHNYKLAQAAVAGRYAWLEEGVIAHGLM